MEIGQFAVVFVFGLVSSLHCVGMCGPIVLSYSLALGGRVGARTVAAHAAYNAGRIATYTALGAVAGFVGEAFGTIGKLAGIENVAAIVAGTFMVVAGLLMLDILPHRMLTRFDPLRAVGRVLAPLGSRISSPTIASKFTLGAMLGFLPCGLIYAALLSAVATGTPVAGGLTMLAFGLGTATALFSIGVVSSVLGLKLGRWSGRLAAVSVALLGLVLVWRGVAPMAIQSVEDAPTHHTCH